MEGRRVILADGRVHEGCECGFADEVLVVYLKDGTTLMDAAVEFSDPDKTVRIRFEYGDMYDIYDGFTVLRSVYADYDEVTVMLKRGAN